MPDERALKIFVQNQVQAQQEKLQKALRDALEQFPASERQEQIAAALAEITGKERRKAVLAELDNLPTDELERLLAS
jgi:hypothetical protein